MNAAEERVVARLRDAAGAVGETVGEVPPFPEARRTGWWAPVLAAVTAAGAVVVTAAAMTVGVGVVAVGRAPEYFAVGDEHDVVFRRSDTGQETGRFPVPEAGLRFGLLASARDGFYVSASADACATRFFRVRLGPGGEVARAEPLTVELPEGTRPVSMAVSADGARLAYGLSRCPGAGANGVERLGVTDLAGGGSRVFASHREGMVSRLSVTGDGRFVAFQRTGVEVSLSAVDGREVPEGTVSAWRGVFGVKSGIPEVWVLDVGAVGTGTGGGDLGAARRVELRAASDVPMGMHGVRISADGRSFTAALGPVHSDGKGTGVIVRFDAGDGGQTEVLHRDGTSGLRLLGGDASGDHPLVLRGDEIGTVGTDGYRMLLRVREPTGVRIAW
ncbi:hypothetical protein [Streptosporangium saharense]|uniref:Uncharacterized protein n=1 Tax=Streptosporangium saharense TaxID=1706840 RepID=A0A7W7QPC5_9ACTN|nr:hypothetical protein [Streptosporangium saharense]MBB4917319.1 hypothetical protein [Streptosporangium saharense]